MYLVAPQRTLQDSVGMEGFGRFGLRGHATALAAAAAFAVGGLAASVSAESRGDPAPTAAPVVTYDAAGYRYSYHVVTGDESLFDLHADPHELHDLSRSRPAFTRELRRALEAKLHVDALDALRGAESDRIRTLRSLGYL
jgi:hypothetical protein